MAGAEIQPLPLTAFYCCALRAADAASASNSLLRELRDGYAVWTFVPER